MLTADELGRRLRAARELRGLSQVALGSLFEADGLDKQAPGRIERGEIPMKRAHREAFLHHLKIPPRWLLADSVDEIVGFVEQEVFAAEVLRRLDELGQQSGVLTELERERLSEVAAVLDRLGRDVGKGRPRQRSGRSNPPEASEPAP